MIEQKTVVCIVLTIFYRQSEKLYNNLSPCDRKSAGFCFSIIYNLCVKFEIDWAKNAICIVPTMLYRQKQNLTLTISPVTRNQWDYSSYHPQLMCEIWNWEKNCNQFFANKIW